ncbi:MAG: DegV family protein [Deltaproteobacteria bacterium]|nr:DegV family protein [Deltaproteobacteria bacterium]
METVKIVTDSGANIPTEVAETLGIEVIPFTLTLNARRFLEGADATMENFYKRRELYHSMTWESPAYHDYALVYMRLVKENRKILFIHSSPALSPIHGTALAVHGDFRASHGAKAVILDSGTWGMGLTLTVTALARAAKTGLPLYRLIALAVTLKKEVGYVMGVKSTKLLAEAYRPRGLGALTSKAAFFAFDKNGVLGPFKDIQAKKGRMVLDLVKHVQSAVGDEPVIMGVEGTDSERLYGPLSGMLAECFNCGTWYAALARPSLYLGFCPEFFALAYVRQKALDPFTESIPADQEA